MAALPLTSDPARRDVERGATTKDGRWTLRAALWRRRPGANMGLAGWIASLELRDAGPAGEDGRWRVLMLRCYGDDYQQATARYNFYAGAATASVDRLDMGQRGANVITDLRRAIERELGRTRDNGQGEEQTWLWNLADGGYEISLRGDAPGLWEVSGRCLRRADERGFAPVVFGPYGTRRTAVSQFDWLRAELEPLATADRSEAALMAKIVGKGWPVGASWVDGTGGLRIERRPGRLTLLFVAPRSGSLDTIAEATNETDEGALADLERNWTGAVAAALQDNGRTVAGAAAYFRAEGRARLLEADAADYNATVGSFRFRLAPLPNARVPEWTLTVTQTTSAEEAVELRRIWYQDPALGRRALVALASIAERAAANGWDDATIAKRLKAPDLGESPQPPKAGESLEEKLDRLGRVAKQQAEARRQGELERERTRRLVHQVDRPAEGYALLLRNSNYEQARATGAPELPSEALDVVLLQSVRDAPARPLWSTIERPAPFARRVYQAVQRRLPALLGREPALGEASLRFVLRALAVACERGEDGADPWRDLLAAQEAGGEAAEPLGMAAISFE